MRARHPFALLLTSLCLAAACGDSDTTTPPPTGSTCGEGTELVDGACVPSSTPLDCGAGTFELDGECVNYDPSDATAPTTTLNPSGGRYRAAPNTVTLTADEPADIHVSIDGSDPAAADPLPSPATIEGVADGTEIRFFAVDPAGNTEAEQTATFTLDAVGTAPVSDFTATPSGSDIDLTWTNPADADFGGVVIARVSGGVDAKPLDGQTYTAGDTISPQLDVIYVGNGTSFTDVGRPIGVSVYTVWAHDDLNNHSGKQSAAGNIALPAQTATVTVNLNSNSVTINPSFANLGLTGTHISDTATSATIELAIENTTSRPLYSVKLVHTNLSEGSLGSTDGTLLGSGDAYWRYWFEGNDDLGYGQLPGTTRSRTMTVSGLTSTTVTFDVEVHENPMFVASTWDNDNGLSLTDAVQSSSDQMGELDTAPGLSHDNQRGVCSSVSLDGRYGYVYHLNNPVISKLDFSSGAAAQSLTPAHEHAKAFISYMHLNEADEHLYAVLNDGHHTYRWDHTRGADDAPGDEAKVYLLRIDPETLQEVGRLQLTVPDGRDSGAHTKTFVISPDGTQAAIPAWSWDGENVGDGDRLPSSPEPYSSWVNIVDLTTMTEVDQDAGTAGTQPMSIGAMHRPRAAAYNPAGTHLYVGSKRWGDNDSSADLNDILKPTLVKIDLSNNAVTVLSNADDDDSGFAGYHTFNLHPNGDLWMAGETGNNAFPANRGVHVLDTSNDQITTVTGTITRDGTFHVAFSADFTRAYVGSYSNDVHVFTVADNQEVGDLGLVRDPYGHQYCVTPF